MRVDTGSYTGDGSDPKTISLTNCSGDCSATDTVILVASKGTASVAYITTDKFDTDYAKNANDDTAQVNTVIKDLGTGSFSVNGTLNTNTEEYLWVALQYDGTTRDIETGSYTGNKTDNETGLMTFSAVTPDLACVMCEENYKPYMATGDTGSDQSVVVSYGGAATDMIQALNSGNCEIGASNYVNRSGYSYLYKKWDSDC